MNYKILVLDIDGTLINPQKKITRCTKNALLKLQKCGTKIVLASGRPVYGMIPLARELKMQNYQGYILAFNGGKIIDCQTNETIFEKSMQQKQICELARKLQNKKVSLITYEKDSLITETPMDPYVQKEARINKMEIKQVNNFAEYIDFPITKCLVTGSPKYLERIEAELKQYFMEALSIYRSEPFFLEIMPSNIDKAAALERLLNYIGGSCEEMVAFGDGLNDISMISYAGVGIAMGNAQELVKKAADFVTRSNDEDGIAYAIERFWKIAV